MWKRAIIKTMDKNVRRDISELKTSIDLCFFELVFVDNLVDVEQPLLSFMQDKFRLVMNSVTLGTGDTYR